MNIAHRHTLGLSMLLVIGVAISLTLFIYYSYSLTERMVARYTPLIDAAMELKLEATTAHLWFEEIISNDQDESMDAVRLHMEQAAWYAEAMLVGGSNAEGNFIPLNDTSLRAHISNVRESLREFRELMELRWKSAGSAGPGSDYDVRFDRVFGEFITEADLVETRLQQLTAEAMANFRNTQMKLVFLTVLVAAGMLYALIVYNRRRQAQLDALDDANRELLSEMALRKQVEEELKRQASTDMLTGLANRHHMSQMLHEETVRAKRYAAAFSVIMFDVDHFKQINDNYGHDRGDEVLREIAARLETVLRETDRLSRWGGEEFLVLLPGTEMAGARELAERCRARLEDEPFEAIGVVTASFGLALYDAKESIRELLHRADEALYHAKRSGRNRIEEA